MKEDNEKEKIRGPSGNRFQTSDVSKWDFNYLPKALGRCSMHS